MPNIDSIIHQPIRLQIMTLLYADKSTTFSNLKNELGLSDGNLGTHLEKLEKHEYIEIHKSFVDKKPQSKISIKTSGEKALLVYIQEMEQIIKGIQ